MFDGFVVTRGNILTTRIGGLLHLRLKAGQGAPKDAVTPRGRSLVLYFLLFLFFWRERGGIPSPAAKLGFAPFCSFSYFTRVVWLELSCGFLSTSGDTHLVNAASVFGLDLEGRPKGDVALGPV